MRFTLCIVLTLLGCAAVSPAHGQTSDTQPISSAIVDIWNHGAASHGSLTAHDYQVGHRGGPEPLGDDPPPATPTPEPSTILFMVLACTALASWLVVPRLRRAHQRGSGTPSDN